MLSKLNPFVRYANILLITESQKDWCIGLDFRIFACLDGSSIIKTKDRKIDFTPNTIVFIPPYTKYSFSGFDKEKNTSAAILNFDLTSENSHIKKALKPIVYKNWDKKKTHTEPAFDYFSDIIVITNQNLCEKVKKITNIFFYKDEFFHERASGTLKNILIEFISKSNDENTSMLAKKIIKYLREHHSENITGNMLSDIFKYHPYHINREIKKATGMNLKAYITDLKIKFAENLLSSTDKSITEIASECGFTDAAYFTKIFKRQKGVTPKNYRTNNKNILI